MPRISCFAQWIDHGNGHGRKLAILLLLLFTGAAASLAAVTPVNRNSEGIAIDGYDPVAYFTQQQPVLGSPLIRASWNGAIWHFISLENRAFFAEDPWKYAPRYGGYCAYAVSKGSIAPIDPQAWTIYKGKLYLNYSLAVRETWRLDIDNHIQRADRNWPQLLNS